MGKRKVLGLIYGYNEAWIGGSYYIENLISCLFTLPSSDQPQIRVYVFNESSHKAILAKDFSDLIDIVFIETHRSILDRILNRLNYLITGRYLLPPGFDSNVDVIFPNPSSFHFDKMKTSVFWIPDFQEKYFPEFFSEFEIERRRKEHLKFAQNENTILVLSSQSALNDYRKFYPENNSKNYVIPFAVTIPSIEGIDTSSILHKYGLSSPFLICCNQFWAHKGHKTLLRSIADIKAKGLFVKVVFTGKTVDDRNPLFFKELSDLAEELGLADSIIFLGFIPRTDQLILMKESLAIIQPSQFEGWSTVVEDAKVLNKCIVVSNLEVHKEQLPEDYDGFFNTNSVESLSYKIEEALEGKVSTLDVNYSELQRDFGKRIMDMIYDVS
jgi:glycosyltransferase involved in cell wall biosynthesis